jgi:hypothetical protein
MCAFTCDHGTISGELSKKVLIVLADTRFACQFLMISQMLEVKNAFKQVVIHPRWTKYMQSLFNIQNEHNARHFLL